MWADMWKMPTQPEYVELTVKKIAVESKHVDKVKSSIYEGLRATEPCKNANAAVKSKDALRVFLILTYLYEKQDWGSEIFLTSGFLESLQKGGLPGPEMLEEYERLKENHLFIETSQWFLGQMTPKIEEGNVHEVGERIREFKNFTHIDNIFQAIDDMIIIAKLNASEAVDWYFTLTEKWEDSKNFYFQEISDSPWIARDLEWGWFYSVKRETQTFDTSSQELEKQEINKWEWFFLFNSVKSGKKILVDKTIFQKIAIQEDLENWCNVDDLWDNIIRFDSVIYRRWEWGEYMPIWKTVYNGFTAYKRFWDKLYVAGKPTWNLTCSTTFIEFVESIKTHFEWLYITWYNNDHTLLNDTTGEDIYSCKKEDFIRKNRYPNDEDGLHGYEDLIKRWERLIAINLKNGGEREIYPAGFMNNLILDYKLKKWKYPLYIDTEDFVRHCPLLKKAVSEVSEVEYGRKYSRDDLDIFFTSKNSSSYFPNILQWKYGKDKAKSEEFKTKYLKREKIIEVLMKIQLLADLDYERNKSAFQPSQVVLNGYFYYKPNYYKILTVSPRWWYQIMRSVNTGRLKLMKWLPLDWEHIEDLGVIDLENYFIENNCYEVKIDWYIYRIFMGDDDNGYMNKVDDVI